MNQALRTAVLTALFTACGGDVTTKTTTEPSTTDTATTRWAEMGFTERKAYMANVVLPEMQSLFETYDRERYADFSCETCHGPSPSSNHFEMPSGHIMKLHPTGSPEQQAMVLEQRDMVTFMYQKVVPTMTRLLDAEPWSDDTKSGFGCFNCHMQGDSAALPTASDEPSSTAP